MDAKEEKKKLRVVILGSTRGTSSENLFQKVKKVDEKLNEVCEIVAVISNVEDAVILERARGHNVDAIFISPKGLKRQTYDAKVSQKLEELSVDLILLVGYMRILSDEFVDRWRGRVLNVHPSLLPEFAGGMDLDVHQQVIDAKKKVTGCTVHFVTEEVDKGKIVVQKKCDVSENETKETLKNKVRALEGLALEEAVIGFYNNEYFLDDPQT